jgi:formate dehydrogenase
MAKVICILYDDPVTGYPQSYTREDLPMLDRYPDGQRLPSPQRIDFKPGALLGSVSGELGLRKFLEDTGRTLIVTLEKDGSGCTFERELPDAEVVISQPFWPAYLTAERIAKAPRLKLARPGTPRASARSWSATFGAVRSARST